MRKNKMVSVDAEGVAVKEKRLSKPHRKRKIIIIVIVVIILLLLAMKIVFGGGKNVGELVTEGSVEKKNIEELLPVTAPLEGSDSIDIVSSLHYEILSISVEAGDVVKKGQVIAELDSSDLQKEIRNLQDKVDIAQIDYDNASSSQSNSLTSSQSKLNDELKQQQNEYESAVADRDTAKNDLDRIQKLYDAGVESKTNLDAAKNKYDDAQRKVDTFDVKNGKVVASDAQLADLKTAQQNGTVETALKNLEMAKQELNDKRADLQNCHIKSSIDGTVTKVNAKVGRYADAIGSDNQAMFEIEDMSSLKMNVKISEYDIGKVKVGQPVSLTADILGDGTVAGIVAKISPAGEEKTGTNERFIPIEIDVVGHNSKLIAGINARAKIQVAISKNTLVVPIESILDNNDDTYSVFVINKDSTVKKVDVKIGVESDLESEIKSKGLKAGDKVVLNPPESLTDGMSVISGE